MPHPFHQRGSVCRRRAFLRIAGGWAFAGCVLPHGPGRRALKASSVADRVAGVTQVEMAADVKHLIGHWKLQGDCRDSSDNGNHGLNRGVDLAAPGPDGKPNGSAQFDGREGFIEIPPGPSLGLGAGDFTIAVWVHTADLLDDAPGDIVSRYDPVRRRGFNLSIKNHAGVTTSQANHRNVHFGIDQGNREPEWTDHGRLGKAMFVFGLSVYRGQLYAGTCESDQDQAGHVYRFAGGEQWVDCGSPDRCNAISSLAVHAGKLYAGCAKYRLAGSALPESENENRGGRIYRYEEGRRWVDCGELPDTDAVAGLVDFRGRLYASSLYLPAGFFRYEADRTWVSCDTPHGKRVGAMCGYNGQLFATSYDGGHVYRYDGSTWTDCGQLGDNSNTQTYSFAVHEGRLYVGTWRSGKVYRYAADGQWEDVGRLGEELEVMGMLVHNGKLYAGTLPLAEVYRFDGGTQWTKVGRVDHTPDVRYRRAWTMAEFQGRLFVGTLPSGHVWSMEAGKNATCDHELAPGWRHLVATRHGRRLKLYVDAAQVAVSTEFEPADFDLSCEQPLKIGFGPNDYLNGRLRDLRIYNRALNDTEIAQLAI